MRVVALREQRDDARTLLGRAEEQEPEGSDRGSADVVIDIADGDVEKLPDRLVVARSAVGHRVRVDARPAQDRVLEHFEHFIRLPVHNKWFGHCLRREPNQICAKSLRLEVSGRSTSRPKQRWRDNIKEDLKKYRLTENMAQDRKYWMTKIMAGPAQGDGQERCSRKKDEVHNNSIIIYKITNVTRCPRRKLEGLVAGVHHVKYFNEITNDEYILVLLITSIDDYNLE